jgi:chaperonin GroES
MSSSGELMSMPATVGEYVKFRDYAGSEIRIQGIDYVVIRGSDCLAKWSV